MSCRSPGRSSSTWFFVAGGLLLVQVVLIGLRRYQIGMISEAWIAPPAIMALVASLVGLAGLYPPLRKRSARLAGAGRWSALVAGGVLGLAAMWILVSALRGGVPQPVRSGFLALIAVFMIAFMLSFTFTAAASLRADDALRPLGYLLFTPVVAWSVILIAGFVTNFGDALKLDFYTNGAVSAAFVAVGGILRKRTAANSFGR